MTTKLSPNQLPQLIEPGAAFAEERAAALFRSLQRHFHDAEHLKILEPIIPFSKRKEPFNHTALAQVVLPLRNEEQGRQELLAAFPQVVVDHESCA